MWWSPSLPSIIPHPTQHCLGWRNSHHSTPPSSNTAALVGWRWRDVRGGADSLNVCDSLCPPLLLCCWDLSSRPRVLSDVAHQDDVVATLRKSMQSADVSNQCTRHTHTLIDMRHTQIPCVQLQTVVVLMSGNVWLLVLCLLVSIRLCQQLPHLLLYGPAGTG